MLLILRTTLRDYRLSLLLMGLGLASLEVLLPTTYTALGPDIQNLLSQMPKGFTAFFKTQGGLSPLLGAEGYMAVGYRHPIYLVIIAAFAIAASSSPAREIEKGTVFLLLARPFPRYHLMLAKGAGLLVGLLILLTAALGGMAFGVAATNLEESVRLSRFILVSVNALLLSLSIGGYGFLLSALSRDGGKAIAQTSGLTVAFFFMDFVAGLWQPLEFLGPWSVFHYYNPSAVVQQGAIPWSHVLVLATIAAAAYAAAIGVFQRRDIP